MLFITTAPFSLLSYYIQEIYGDEETHINFRENLDAFEFKAALVDGDFLTSKIYVVSLRSEKPPNNLVQSAENTTYVSISTPSALKDWRKLIEEKDWIEELKLRPERYKGILNSSHIFTEEAEDWFWRKFKNHPGKMKREILNLECRFNFKIPLSFLQAFYSANSVDLFIRLRNQLGSTEATQTIKDFTDSDLWVFFIGTEKKPSFLKISFIDSQKERNEDALLLEVPLMHLIDAVTNRQINMRAAAVLFNQWLVEIGTKRVNGNLKLKYSIEDISRLENYLGI